MHVATLVSTLGRLLPFSGGDRGQTGGAAAVEPRPQTPASPPEEIRNLLLGKDLRRISPRDFSSLLQELQRQPKADPALLRDLSSLRLALDAAGAPLDQPLDLVEFSADRVAWAQAAGDGGGSDGALESAKRQHGLIVGLARWSSGAPFDMHG
jgi:hypothetical protein